VSNRRRPTQARQPDGHREPPNIESALRPIDGIRSVQVVVEDKTATFDFDREVIERSAVVAVIEGEGYPVSG
jgi:copper chaperone CopZ